MPMWKPKTAEIGDALTEVIALFHTLMLPLADLLERLPLPSVRRFAQAPRPAGCDDLPID